ncbi:MAG TPA: FAD binding domain-containing protein [Candidatus Sulfotelmatobacter sp.]|nr:FAD binding domain-containing protein [Candidatus Sulfotelmatobacter sp.]
MSLPQFKLLRPRTIDEALGFLAQYTSSVGTDRVGTDAFVRPARAELARATEPAHPVSSNVRVIAGGTDLIPSMRQKLFEPQYVLDLRGISALRGIKQLPDGGAEIGALTSLRDIERSLFLLHHYPVLSEAAATVASPVLRNMGTIGGNICLDTRCLWYNQSLTWRKGCGFCIKKDGDLCHVAPGGAKCWAAFSGDTPPALLCLQAEIEIASAAGVRRVPVSDFYTGLGEDYRRLQPNELVTRVFLPASSADYVGVYRKLRVRGSIDYPLAGVAVVMKRSSNGNGASHVTDARVGITAVNPAPLLVKGASELLAGRAVDEALAEAVGDLAAKTAKPLTTSALTPEYRREMIRVFAKRAVLAAFETAGRC